MISSLSSSDSFSLLRKTLPDVRFEQVLDAISEKQPLTEEQGLMLYEASPLNWVGALANMVRKEKNGDAVYFNRNIHIEPTNICVFDCKFCSYSRLLKNREDGWELTEEQILNKVREYVDQPITEVHIVGGVHPKMGLHFFAQLIQKIKSIKPELHVKAFTAVELEYMCRKAKVSFEEGLTILKVHGQDSLPGGGAEIFHPEIREQICADKCTADQWLSIHETAHRLGMPSNATMLYGHIESYAHRIDHMERLRKLQTETGGFNTFIPLKFRNQDNQMSHLSETSVVEDLRNYAIGRLYLHNFQHIKAYWPMIGRQVAQLSLHYGVDDLDGTIDDTTKIYSMAGSEEQSPKLSTAQLVALIKQAGRRPIERNTTYEIVRDYSENPLEEVETP
jgi:aminodeoxyfutalosine synthase